MADETFGRVLEIRRENALELHLHPWVCLHPVLVCNVVKAILFYIDSVSSTELQTC